MSLPSPYDSFPECKEPWAQRLHVTFSSILSRFSTTKCLITDPPKIDFYVLEHGEPNAFATKTENGYAVAFPKGLYELVARLHFSILADPRTFLAIGDPTAETVLAVDHVVLLDDFVSEMEKRADRIPKDPTRVHFANHLTELSLRFIVAHELCHVLLGHMEFTGTLHKETDTFTSLSEEQNFGIEMHADEIAFTQCVFWIIDSLSGVETDSPKGIFIQTNDAQFQDLYLGAYAIFELFSHLVMSNSHPNPLHRQIRLGVILDYLCDAYKIPLINKPHELVAQAFVLFDEYMKSVFNIDWSDRKQETELIYKHLDDELSPYDEYVKALLPELKSKTHLKLD